jgi:hypothetical protein
MPEQLDASSRPSNAPVCASCGQPASVQWRRRSTTDPASVEAVYACGQHPISLEAAALVHQPTCPAPDLALLPACGCVPEPAEPVTAPGQDVITLPTGWTIPTSP